MPVVDCRAAGGARDRPASVGAIALRWRQPETAQEEGGMSSQDDLTLLKEMYQRGEISDSEYDTLRRHVLWGTPLPELIDEPTMVTPPPAAPQRPAAPPPRPPEAPRRPPWEVPTDETFSYEPPRQVPAAEPAREPWEVPEPARPGPHAYDAGPAPARHADPGPTRHADPGPTRHADPGPARHADTGPARHADPGPGSQPGRDSGPGRRAEREPRRRADAGPVTPAPPRHADPGPPSQPMPPRRADPGAPSRPVPAPPRHADPGTPGQPGHRPRDPGPPSQPVRRPETGPAGQAMPAPPRHVDPGPASQPVRRPPDLGPPSQPVPRPPDLGPPSQPVPRPPDLGPPSQPVPRPPDLGPPSQPVRRVDGAPARRADPAARPGAPSQPGYRPDREPVPDQRMPWETGPAPKDRKSRREERESGPTPVVSTGRRRGPRLVAVIVAVVLALGVAGFGGWYFTLRKTGTAPADYAKSVCGGMKAWKQDVDGQGSALSASIKQIDDLPAIRTRVVAYYDTLAGRTETLRASLVGAGTPDLPGGTEYADALVRAIGDQVSALRDATALARRLDVTGSQTLFQISLSGLLSNAATAEGKVVDALAHPSVQPPAELASALTDNADCTPFTG
jgi:hypothetical protein